MNEEKPNYYAIIPSEVRYDDDLTPNEKLLYGEITALTYQNGECWATNSYFAKLYKVEIQSVSRWIRHLKSKNYLDIEIIYKEGTKEIVKRIIKIIDKPINKNVKGYKHKCLEGINKNVKENNTSINNTSNNIKENIKRKVFKKPTIDEIKEYCLERNNGINAEAFYDFYESKDWYVGKNKMKDWKACVRTWEQRKGGQNYSSKIKSNIDPFCLIKKADVPEWFDKDIKATEGIENNEIKELIKNYE